VESRQALHYITLHYSDKCFQENIILHVLNTFEKMSFQSTSENR